MSGLTSPPVDSPNTLPLPLPALSANASTASPTRNNPISTRLWKITSRSTLDKPTQDALKIISDHYCTPKKTSAEAGPSKKHNYWLSENADLDDDSSSSSSSSFSDDDDDEPSKEKITTRKFRRTLLRKADPEAAIRARKNFKKDLEGELARGSVRFLEAFGKVDQKLQVLRNHLEEMQSRCEAIQSELDNANRGTRSLLDRAKGLQEQKASTEMRSILSTTFISHFTLSPTEIDTLHSKEITIDEPLLKTMDRIKRIRADCGTLFTLAGDDSQSVLESLPNGKEDGLGVEGRDPVLVAKEIMSLAGDQLDLVFGRIHRACCFEFRRYTKETSLEVTEVVRESVKRLRERVDLLEDALQILTDTRQNSIASQFHIALTRGGPDGLPRPIEIHAHDPTRYIGDMLAWVHQTTAGENEFLDGLFDVRRNGRRMVGQTREFGGTEKEGEDEKEREIREREKLARGCLNKDLEGLCSPLKIRIQHTVDSQEGVIMAYKITNLVQFYLVTMERTIGKENILTQTLSDIYDSAQTAFLDRLDAQGRSLLRFLHPPDNTLSPPQTLRDSAHTLTQILTLSSTSLVEESDRAKEYGEVVQRGVGPVWTMCEKMAGLIPGVSNDPGSTGKGGKGDWERAVFLVNCGMYLQHVMEPYPFTMSKRTELGTEIERWERTLLEGHSGNLLKESGLEAIVKAIRKRQDSGPEEDKTPLSRVPGTDPKSLTKSIKTLETFLSSINILSSPRLALLSSPRISSDIHQGALANLARDYKKVYEVVMRKEEGYEFASTVLGRSPEEVFVLLGVDEGEGEPHGP